MKITSHEFHDHDQLLHFLTRMASTRLTGKLSIMAGHYMLIYRRSTKELVPLMPSISLAEEATIEEKIQVKMVGDFPEASFELGLRVLEARGQEETKIALLVNDHQFLVFQPDLPSTAEVNVCRRHYFRSNESIPAPFAAIAAHYNISGDFIEDNDDRRTSGGTLPSQTIYFSETVLRNRLSKRKRRRWLLTREGCEREQNLAGESRIIYRFPDGGRKVCLIDEQGACGCSGEIIEFLLALMKKGAKHVLLFVPEICREPVQASIEACMRSFVDFHSVIAVWGGVDAVTDLYSAELTPAKFLSLTMFASDESDAAR